MSFKVYVGGSRKLTEIECEGTGTKEDPLFIRDQEFPKGLEIVKQENHFIFKDCIVNNFSFVLKKCQNFKIQGGKYNNISIEGSSKFLIQDSLIVKQLSLQSCGNAVIEGCSIDKIRVFRSARPIVSNCSISNWTTRAY